MNVETAEFDTNDLPLTVDWRTKGAVTPVQNQLNCISAWAFSAVSAMEGAHFVATGELVKLSDQQCIDCAISSGCYGAQPYDCFEYAKYGATMQTIEDYPFTGTWGSCEDQKKGPITESTFT